jgi:hypothetical protein
MESVGSLPQFTAKSSSESVINFFESESNRRRCGHWRGSFEHEHHLEQRVFPAVFPLVTPHHLFERRPGLRMRQTLLAPVSAALETRVVRQISAQNQQVDEMAD